jgi:ribosomal protein L7/L12
MANLDDQQRQAIETAIFAGRKIEAIKLYREAMGVQLVDAKRAVEDLEVDLRRRSPENFVASASKKGCVGVLVCVVLLAAFAAFWSFYFLRS